MRSFWNNLLTCFIAFFVNSIINEDRMLLRPKFGNINLK